MDFDKNICIASLYTPVALPSSFVTERDSLSLSSKKRYCGRLHDVVEDGGSVYEQNKARYLEPFKGLPSESKADQPNEKSSASVDGTPCSGRDDAGNTETEKVEATVASQYELNSGSFLATHPMEIMIKNEVSPIDR